MVKGVTVIEAWMEEGSGYCRSGGGIESMSDAVKIANMVMTCAGEGNAVMNCSYHSQISDNIGLE